jgi:hypothetical protein
MSANPDSTLPSRRIPVIVLIAPGSELLAACTEMARHLDEMPNVQVADVARASTVIAEWRPFAVLILEPVFAFDPSEFESLAEAVGAGVMVIDPEEASTALVPRLLPRLKEMFAWWEARQAVSP